MHWLAGLDEFELGTGTPAIGPILYASTLDNGDVFIGRFNSAAGGNFTGTIDELSIYNRALTPTEVGGLFNAGTFGKCAGAPNPVNVSGRVLTPDGRGLRNVRVSITDPSGSIRTATTSSFGYYSFAGVLVGGPYTLAVLSKRYHFFHKPCRWPVTYRTLIFLERNERLAKRRKSPRDVKKRPE